jgi:polyisoprenoid-binding protein YceI
VDADTYRIVGNLTLHGVTNELVLTAEVNGVDLDPYGNEKVGLESPASSAAASTA